MLSHVQLFVTPWTVTHQTSLSMEFSRQEYWSALPFPSPEELHNPGIEPWSPTSQADSLLFELQGSLWFLPSIDMNQPWVYMCPLLPKSLLPPSPSHPSGSSQCTSFECPVSCTELRLLICFTYGNAYASVLFSQIIPPLPSPIEPKSLFFLYLCLFCYLAFRVIITIFPNSIYMH